MADEVKNVEGNLFDGYVFLDDRELEKAKKEKSIIDKLEESLDLNRVEEVHQIYNRLLERKYFSTPIGIGFLRDIREYLVKELGEDNILPVPVSASSLRDSAEQGWRVLAADLTKENEELKDKNDRLHILKNRLAIAVAALCVIVIGMFFIIVTNENLGYFNAEEKVLNKYSAWQERLESWEEQLNEREELLAE